MMSGKNTKKKVAVVGSGVAGLSAAYLMHRNGKDVTLYESAPRCGGHALTVDSTAGPVDLGFQVGEKTKRAAHGRRKRAPRAPLSCRIVAPIGSSLFFCPRLSILFFFLGRRACWPGWRLRRRVLLASGATPFLGCPGTTNTYSEVPHARLTAPTPPYTPYTPYTPCALHALSRTRRHLDPIRFSHFCTFSRGKKKKKNDKNPLPSSPPLCNKSFPLSSTLLA